MRKDERKKGGAKPSTALVRAKQPPAVASADMLAMFKKVLKRIEPPRNITPAPEPPEAFQELTERAMLGDLGLVELKLTPEEEAILNEPVPVSEVLVKPSGQPYLSHPSYYRWMNRAFGRTGWLVKPVALPMKSERGVVVPYVLLVHGKAVGFAFGEQDYYGGEGGNREQSWGDALEATVAYALRRCMKHLGIGLELWDKTWINNYMNEHAVRVRVLAYDRKARKKVPKWQYRRKVDPPFYNEIVGGKEPDIDEEHGDALDDGFEHAQRRPSPPPAPPAQHGKSGEVITPAQVQRLQTILSNSGRNKAVVKAWLKSVYGYDSSKEIKRHEYNAVCSALEAEGSLPLKKG